jgi:hypothetical protein
MNFQEEALKALLGLSITGIVSAFVWLFKWLDRTELRLHDYDRDLNHIKRKNQDLSSFVANLDIKDEKMVSAFRQTIYSLSGRVQRIETRVYVVENRLSDGLTQAIADRLNTQSLEVRKDLSKEV